MLPSNSKIVFFFFLMDKLDKLDKLEKFVCVYIYIYYESLEMLWLVFNALSRLFAGSHFSSRSWWSVHWKDFKEFLIANSILITIVFIDVPCSGQKRKKKKWKLYLDPRIIPRTSSNFAYDYTIYIYIYIIEAPLPLSRFNWSTWVRSAGRNKCVFIILSLCSFTKCCSFW